MGMRFFKFFQHGSIPKPYNNIMLPCDSGDDESISGNSNANFPKQNIQLRLRQHCVAQLLSKQQQVTWPLPVSYWWSFDITVSILTQYRHYNDDTHYSLINIDLVLLN